MILSELIQRIQSLYSHGVQSDDTRLSPRHIYNKLVTTRSKLLYDKLQYQSNLHPSNYQLIECLEMVKVPNHECPCLPPTGCKVIRSKHKLPKMMVANGIQTIKFVRTIDRHMYYKKTTLEKERLSKGNKFFSLQNKYYVENDYLYIIQQFGPLVLSISALFEDPLEVKNFPQYCPKDVETEECKSFLDIEFPIDAELIEPLIQLTIDELVRMFYSLPEDLSNDSKDSNINGTK